MRLDARIPVCLVAQGDEPAPARGMVLVRVGRPIGEPPSGWAAVRDVPEPSPADHRPACVCGVCGGRSALGSALGVLFAQRAKAELALFDRVVLSVPPGDELACIAVLRTDPLVAGRYRHDVEN